MAVRPRSRCSDRVLRFALPTLLGAFALVLPGCGGEASGAPPPPVERVAQQLARGGADSVIVFVSDDGREYVATAGNHRPGGDQRFRVGSVTKTFTATIVLQLVAEGRLRLSDPLERHLPGIVPGGKKITIRQLLNHRSGLANFTDYPDWLERASRSPSTRPIDALRFAAAQPLVVPTRQPLAVLEHQLHRARSRHREDHRKYVPARAQAAHPRPARTQENGAAKNTAAAGSRRRGRESQCPLGGRRTRLGRP